MKLDQTKSTAPEKNPSLFMPKAKETVSNKIKKHAGSSFCRSFLSSVHSQRGQIKQKTKLRPRFSDGVDRVALL